MRAGRFKSYDYAVLVLFVLVVIGVSLSWYTISLKYESTSIEAGAGGWHYAWGILAFVAGLFALIIAGLKGLVGPDGVMPGWYKEGPLLMGFGDLVTLFAIIGFLDRPGHGAIGGVGIDIGYGLGIYLTLIAGVLLGACGIIARFDKPATAVVRAPAPYARAGLAPYGAAAYGTTATGSMTQAAPLVLPEFRQYCPACTSELKPGSKFCNSCGMPLS